MMGQKKVDIQNLLTPPSTARPVDRGRRVFQQIKGCKNWFQCLRISKGSGKADGSYIEVIFRDGFRMSVRDGTPDIFVLWEVFLAGGYASTERLIRAAAAPCCVIDMGAHIGAFTLRCARVPSQVEIHSYEPGPDNFRVLNDNLSSHGTLQSKVRLFHEAVAGKTGESGYFFDGSNPGGSHLCSLDQGVRVQTRSFKEIVQRCPYPVALLKIDIEGAEYDLLDSTEKADWADIPAVMVELHEDPSGHSSPAAWLNRLADFGFQYQVREFSTLLLTQEEAGIIQ